MQITLCSDRANTRAAAAEKGEDEFPKNYESFARSAVSRSTFVSRISSGKFYSIGVPKSLMRLRLCFRR